MAISPERIRHMVRGDVSWRTVFLSADGHDVPVRVFTPGQPSGWLVWAHGGSWSRGSVEQWHAPCVDLAARSSCVVVSVDYRLAPRHQHPAPVDDVLTAMTWVRQQMEHEGTPPALLAVGGDSAGGTLAASAALTWRDHGHPLAAQVLAYPPFDPSCQAASYKDVGRFPDRFTMRAAWAAHLGAGTAATSHSRYASPLDAHAMENVASAILAVGDLDPVRDDVAAYAQRLRQANVHVIDRLFHDTGHGAFTATEPHSPPASVRTAGEHRPTMRTWLADTLRNHLVGNADEPSSTSPPTGPR